MDTPDATMRAAVCTAYGPPEVVTIRHVPRPKSKPDQALVRIDAAAITTGDARIRAWDIPSLVFAIPARLVFGIRKPRRPILGWAFAGTIEAAGDQTHGFAPGDRVFGTCESLLGAHTEYIAVRPEKNLRTIPESLTTEQAAALPFPGAAALAFLRDRAKLQPGQRLLIVGASGALGTGAVQYARHIGAHITAVCSGKNEAFVRDLGAHEVIDYTRGDWTKQQRPRDQRFDVIYDTVGKTTFNRTKHMLKERAVYITAVMRLPELLQTIWTPIFSKRVVKSGVAASNAEYLETLARLAESGAMVPPIERVYPLDQIADAHRDIDTGHRSGMIVIRMTDPA